MAAARMFGHHSTYWRKLSERRGSQRPANPALVADTKARHRRFALPNIRLNEESNMSDISYQPTVTPTPIALGQIAPWAIFAGLLLLLAIYFVGAEEGATSLISGMYVHEFVHDGRHLLGFPCH
jgi:hypothetical protein